MIQRSDLEHPKINPHFIGSWTIESLICDEIVEYFENNKQKQTQGSTASGLNLESKNRKDISISPKDIKLDENKVFEKYFESIFECYKDYNLQWPFLKQNIGRLEIGRFNLGRYEKGQHYQNIHCERSGLRTVHRLFAFMTYLNNVEKGGSTYFSHYNLDVQPKKGLSLIWPADWTHAHKGNVINAGCKYIVTGWLSFAE